MNAAQAGPSPRPILGGRCGINVALSHGMAPRFLSVYHRVHTRARGASVSLQNSAAPWTSNPGDCSAVIVAASVLAGTYQRPVRRWVKTHLEALNQRPTAFLSLCLAVLNRTPKVERDLDATLQRFFDEAG